MADESIDQALLQQKQAQIVSYGIGARVAAMISLGIELDLYSALREGGAATPEELAARTGLRERWLREWLYQQAASRILDYDASSKRFSISIEVWTLIGDPDELRTLRTNFVGLALRMSALERLPEAFRSGLGFGWDERGSRAAEFSELTFRNWYRQVLVPQALPLLDGVVAALRDGATAADIGCGTGFAMIEMARAFPKSNFHGYDTSQQSIARGRDHVREAGVPNVTFHDVIVDPLPSVPAYDFITTFDCLHDMTHPHEAAEAIRSAIKPEGVWFIADINGAPDFEGNLASRPLSSLLYATSVLGCLSSALSEEGGAGYGTLGLPEPAMRELVLNAGFTKFRPIEDLRHPINAYYEARP